MGDDLVDTQDAEKEGRAVYPALGFISAWIIAAMGIVLPGRNAMVLLFPAGVLFVAAGLGVLFDYAGSARWIAYVFGNSLGTARPLAVAPWQIRGIGVFTFMLGLAFAIAGLVTAIDVM